MNLCKTEQRQRASLFEFDHDSNVNESTQNSNNIQTIQTKIEQQLLKRLSQSEKIQKDLFDFRHSEIQISDFMDNKFKDFISNEQNNKSDKNKNNQNNLVKNKDSLNDQVQKLGIQQKKINQNLFAFNNSNFINQQSDKKILLEEQYDQRYQNMFKQMQTIAKQKARRNSNSQNILTKSNIQPFYQNKSNLKKQLQTNFVKENQSKKPIKQEKKVSKDFQQKLEQKQKPKQDIQESQIQQTDNKSQMDNQNYENEFRSLRQSNNNQIQLNLKKSEILEQIMNLDKCLMKYDKEQNETTQKSNIKSAIKNQLNKKQILPECTKHNTYSKTVRLQNKSQGNNHQSLQKEIVQKPNKIKLLFNNVNNQNYDILQQGQQKK